MRIFTIGYGGRKFEDFVETLKRFSIEQVIDVRAFPTSKYPGFKMEELETLLPKHGLKYTRIEELGGYRKGGYESYTRSVEFKRGIEKLMRIASEKPSVILCLETHPSGCHRRFIARELARKGWEVVHILGKDKIALEIP